MGAELCIALDGSSREWIVRMAAKVAPACHWLKIGLEAFTAFGPELIGEIADLGPRVFLDLKLHDIPNTVAGAAANAVVPGVGILNLHASGGREMMKAADQRLRERGLRKQTALIAVTLLTSLDGDACEELGFAFPPEELVSRWAKTAQESGMDGVVASAREIQGIRSRCGSDFLIVTPGIRPEWAAGNDQKRVMTPAGAVSLGADILVIGRPVTQAENPLNAIERIRGEMEAAVL